MDSLKSIAEGFNLTEKVHEIKPLGIGNINTSFVVKCKSTKYVLQRINTDVFHDPYGMMNNIRLVTEHLKKKISVEGGDPERGTLSFVPAKDGTLCHKADDGIYRMYSFIDDVSTIQNTKSTDEAYRTAYAFGEFQRRLSDFNPDCLTETIPDFHNTQKRYEAFMEIVESDPLGRASEVVHLIEYAKSEAYLSEAITKPLKEGLLPLRVSHNDTKINNVLFDNETGQGICVIDLDTVMPATSLYDFGDMVRSGANATEEDDTNLDIVKINMDYYRAFLKGFVDGTGGSLTKNELSLLAMSAKVIAFELAIRFLGDYINGDKYFSVRREGHNKDRAANQLKLLSSMEENYEEMCSLV